MHPEQWELPFFGVWGLLYLIVLGRAGSTYALGRAARRGAARFTHIGRLLASPRARRVEALLDRWGAPLVAASFLTIGFQTLANAAAGATRMALVRYLPALALGGAAWALIYAGVGFAGFAAVRAAYERDPDLTVIVVALLAFALAAFLAVRLLRRRGAGSPPPEAAGGGRPGGGSVEVGPAGSGSAGTAVPGGEDRAAASHSAPSSPGPDPAAPDRDAEARGA